VQHGNSFQALTETLKVGVATLRDAAVPFMLGGSLAAWARGGPEPQKDLDVMVKPEDADAALKALADAGMRTERPPEEWLYKAWNGEVLIDVIFRPSGLEINDEVLGRADTMSVMAVGTPVMAIEDMLVTMLYALNEHALDYSGVLAIARSLREQIDWPRLHARTSGSPYAKAFFTLVEELGIAARQSRAAPAGPSRVRVLPSAG
jgi:Uncharacterised nucleotidyltransferase